MLLLLLLLVVMVVVTVVHSGCGGGFVVVLVLKGTKCESFVLTVGSIPPYSTLQMEAPTGYLAGDFTRSRSYDHHTGQLVNYDNHKPVVMSTPDDGHAMGVYSPPHQDTDRVMYYGMAHFPSGTSPAATNKWNVVFRKNTFHAGSTHVLNYDVYICVGRVSDVTACLKTLTDRGLGLIG